MNPVRIVIVDDERLARVGLRRQLSRFPNLTVVGECGDGRAAVALIESAHPDLVFLDVRMPELDGFQVIEAIGPDRMPAVIFLTAYEEHALRAFDADAVDYLVKPVDPDRLDDAVRRALRRTARGPADELPARLEALLRHLNRPAAPPDRLAVEVEGRYHLIDPNELAWVEADGNYVRLHAARRTFRLRGTLDELERRLADRFLRVSRSALVNRSAIEAIEPFLKGSYVLFLKGGIRIRSGRSYRPTLLQLLDRHD